MVRHRVSHKLPGDSVQSGRKAQRIIGSFILAGALIAVFAAGGWWLNQDDALPIKRVMVEGEFRYLDKEDLYTSIGDLASGGFFHVDVRAVKQAAESLPWVYRASVRRQWPDSLRIEIEEQTPLAYWGEDQIVNIRGEVFSPEPNTVREALPRFGGPDGTSRFVVTRYHLLSDQLAFAGLSIAELNLNDRRAWDIGLQNGMHLILGRGVSNTQLQRFVSVYPQLLQERDSQQMEYVDLRYSNGFAVRWINRQETGHEERV